MYSVNSNGQNQLVQQLYDECQIMAQHALTSGLPVATTIVQAIDQFAAASPEKRPEHLAQLTEAHQALVKVVAPARPETLVLLASGEQCSWLCRLLGPVPLVRQLTALAIFFLLLFITSTVFQVDDSLASEARDLRLFELLKLAYYLAAAGLGAAFAALFKANRYIVTAVFDPTYAFSYWIRFILGLMAGLILAILLPVNDTTFSLSPVLLALLGGFSSDVLHHILSRLIQTLESVVQGPSQPQVAAK